MEGTELIRERINASIEAKRDFLHESHNIKLVAEEIIRCFKNGNKVLIFGNGGSAADAQHITGELVGRYKLERKGLPAIALTTDTSVLTAWSNDYEYATVFSRQVEALAKKGDILLGISTSGNSDNVIRAFEEGKRIGTINISMTGKDGGKLRLVSDLNINSSSHDTPRVQECHLVAYHTICELVEKEMKDYKNQEHINNSGGVGTFSFSEPKKEAY
jgi:D-sedoheptulose 7-phosphate isomerase